MHLFYLKDSAGYRVDGSLGHEGADLFSSPRQAFWIQLAGTVQEREREKKKIHLNKSFNLLSFVFVLKKKKNEKISPMWGHADFSTCWICFQQQQITPQRPFEQLSTWLKYQKKRGELNYKHVNCQTTLPDDLERFETLRNSPPPPTTSTFSN